MAEFIAEHMATKTDLSEDSSPARTAGPEVFATISSILVKQILELREALEFYEMHCFHAAQSDADAHSLNRSEISGCAPDKGILIGCAFLS
jgi:hypothetical protein